MDHQPLRRPHAVVLGASIAGLLAARVLSDFYDHVTVLDRDHLPTSPQPRKGVPQAVHSHGLLARGLQVLEELHPGITDELVAQGAWLADMHRQGRFYIDGRPFVAGDSDVTIISLSRPLLEYQLANRTKALTGVTIRGGCEAVGLVAPDGRTVTGVRVHTADADAADEVLDADLVVDATGRSNRGPTWLRELGFEPAPEESVACGVVYATREYRRTEADGTLVGIAAPTFPSTLRGCASLAAEGDRWVCTLVGYNDDAPPTDAEAFTALAAPVLAPELHAMIARSQPLTDVVRMRMSPSTRRHYEKLSRVPDGYLVVGDALCYFNPTYGQGMTIAALEVLTMRDALRAGFDDLPRRYFRTVAKVVDAPWQMSSGGDLRFPWVEGKRPPGSNIMNGYLDRLFAAATEDAVVARAFLRAMNMVAPQNSLFAPAVLRRVLRRRRRAATRVAPVSPATTPTADQTTFTTN